MTPNELENSINDTFGEDIIKITEDDKNVIISFHRSGEPKLYAIKNIKEFVSTDNRWECNSNSSPTDDMWIFQYN